MGSILPPYCSEKATAVHFRVRSNVVQFVRTTYDPDSKKPKAQVVGRVPKGAANIPDSLRKLLTEREVSEAEAWLLREQRTIALREELAARTLAESLAAANRWFSKQDNLAEHEWILSSILPEMQTLRKTIKRALT